MSIAKGILTDLFERARAKDARAVHEIARLVYLPLRNTARKLVARNAKNTVQPTELVNEALAELLKDEVFENAVNRKYFFKAASTAMRQILVDHARRATAAKRGGEAKRVRLDEILDHLVALEVDVVALDDAIAELEKRDPRQAEVVSLRFFVGLSMREIAEQLEVSISTVESDWRLAKAWLFRQFHGE